MRYLSAPEGYAVAVGGGVEGVLGWLRNHAAAFGLYSQRADFHYLRYTQSETRTSLRFGQSFDGVPVHGAELIVQTTASGIETVFADVLRDTYILDAAPEAMTPIFGPEDAEAFALAAASPRIELERSARLDELTRAGGELSASERNAIRAELEATQAAVRVQAELVVFAPEVIGMPGYPRLAYRTIIRSEPTALLDENIFIDARTGESLFTASRIRNLGDRKVFDVNGATTTDGFTTPTREETQSPVSDPEVDDNYDILGTARSHFTGTLGWTGYINPSSPSEIKSYVDWGSTGYAAWDFDSKTLRFGQSGYAQTDDVVGHEYTHGVLDQVWSGHLATGETGAIAESICDFFGEMIDVAYTGNDSGDPAWAIGEDLTGGAVRDMSDPAAHDQPGWTGSTLYYTGDPANAEFASTNSGVINHFWALLVDGGTYRDITVPGFNSITSVDGEDLVQELVWYWAENTALTGSDFNDLYVAIRARAKSLYHGTSTPTEAEALEIIDLAAEATGIITDITPTDGPKNSGFPANSFAYVWEDDQTLSVSGGVFYLNFANAGKKIPYKVYVPIDGNTRPDAAGDADWPLDVIVFSHGAGMNRNAGMGYDEDGDGYVDEGMNEDDFEALASLWAKHGYIVVAPTHRKRVKGVLGSDLAWERPNKRDSIQKVVSDFLRVQTHPSEFFTDRIHELQAVLDNVGTIINNSSRLPLPGDPAERPYVEGVSRIALAGYSFGASTAQLAAGQILKSGGSSGTLIDLTAMGLRRVNDNGTPSNLDDDSGPFLDADAFLSISGDEWAEEQHLFVLNTAKPVISGRDYIQRPFMMTTGSLDILPTASGGINGAVPSAALYDPVTKAVGINDHPSYGLVINEVRIQERSATHAFLKTSLGVR